MKSLAIAALALLAAVITSACQAKIDGKIKGSAEVSDETTCTMPTAENTASAGICYDINGSLADGQLQFSGLGFFDPTACTHSPKNGVCCAQSITGTAMGSHDGQDGTFNFTLMGESCVKSKKPTIAKLSKGMLMVTGTGGVLKGVQGVAKVTFTETCDSDCSAANPGPGAGPIQVSGHEIKP